MLTSGFLEKPSLSTPFPDNRQWWICPKTGLKIPKRENENITWREKLLKQAEKDIVLQQDLLAACKESILVWINLFAWTYHQFDEDPETGKELPSKQPHRPMLTWSIQDELINWMTERFEQGEDGLIDKSRKMGASWCCLEFCHHLWLFRPGTEIREMSRVEDLVDSAVASSLFWKHDYLNSRLPIWMCPPRVLVRGQDNRTKNRIYNELNGSTIAGSSTQKHSMRADRAAIILLDEFSSVEEGQAIRTSTASVAPCRIVNSTTTGAGTEYSRWKNSGQIKVFSLMFWEHPAMGAGRFVLQDEVTKRYQITSPWLERQRLRRSEREVASEILAIDLEAGDTFFSLNEIEKHISLFARSAKQRFNIELKKGIANDGIFQILRARDKSVVSIHAAKEGKLEVWCELIDGRPDQSRTYIFGIDTSKGQGASESVVSIKCRQTGEIIAKWKCRHTPPYDFARIIVGLALWCGGANPQRLSFLVWENNGPGWDLGRLLVQEFKSPYYYTSHTIGVVTEKDTKKYGFQANRQSKVLLLRAYERALKTGLIINHDKRGLEQAKYYIFYPGGGCGPAELSDKSASEMLLHGDIVMADALTVEDKTVFQPKVKGPVAPYGSFGWFKDRHKAKSQTGWQMPWDFGGIKR